MILPSALAKAVEAARHAGASPAYIRRAIALLDLTSLGDHDTEADVEALCARAVTPEGPVAAVCVWPRFVPLARQCLAGTGVRIATVVNFPGGADDWARVAADATAARQDGADEVDVVFPYRAFLVGERAFPQAVLNAARRAIGVDGTMKVILETGAFTSVELLAWAGRDALHGGADFLKTSTGKIAKGASLEAAAVLLDTVGTSAGNAGVKISGGVRDTATAIPYLHLAESLLGPDAVTPRRFRFGASGLLTDLLATLGHRPAPAAATGY